MGRAIELSEQWLRGELSRYSAFYDQAFDVLTGMKNSGLLVRWEDLVAHRDALARVVDFVGLPTKLRCSFVWSLMRFENLVAPGARTFYRSGTNEAWKADTAWVEALSNIEELSFERFGYPAFEKKRRHQA